MNLQFFTMRSKCHGKRYYIILDSKEACTLLQSRHCLLSSKLSWKVSLEQKCLNTSFAREWPFGNNLPCFSTVLASDGFSQDTPLCWPLANQINRCSDHICPVYVIQIKRPVEFFLYCPPKQNRKTFDEILKRNTNTIWYRISKKNQTLIKFFVKWYK